jgi:hypothetical protein
MRRLLLAAALPVLAGAACHAGRGAGASPFPQGGRFVAERVARRTSRLVDGPAWATYCPSDSMLVVVVLGRAWNGGLALRMVGPLEVPRDFQVQLSVGDVGTAAAAFRAAPAGTARVGVGGTVHLAVTSTVDGRFDIALPDSGREHVTIRGTLSRIPYRVLRAATCSPI